MFNVIRPGVVPAACAAFAIEGGAGVNEDGLGQAGRHQGVSDGFVIYAAFFASWYRFFSEP